MSDVVQEGRRDRHQARALQHPPLLRDLPGGEERVEDPLRHEGHADRVGEAGVLRAVERQEQSAELPDAPQSLELAGVQEIDDHPLPILVESDRTVDRVAQVLVRQGSLPRTIPGRSNRIRQHRNPP